MADTLNPLTPPISSDYDAYKTKIAETAAATRDVGTTDASVVSGATKAVGGLRGSYKGIGEAAVAQYGQQEGTQKKQAEKAATALEMQGGATIDYLQRLDTIREGVTSKAGAAREAWAAAPERGPAPRSRRWPRRPGASSWAS